MRQSDVEPGSGVGVAERLTPVEVRFRMAGESQLVLVGLRHGCLVLEGWHHMRRHQARLWVLLQQVYLSERPLAANH